MPDIWSQIREQRPPPRRSRWPGLIGGLLVLGFVGGFVALGLWFVSSDRFNVDLDLNPGVAGPPRVPVTPAPVEPSESAPPPAVVPAPDLAAIEAAADAAETPQAAEPAEPEAGDPESAQDGTEPSLEERDPLGAWARDMATVVDAPPRALRAYANAEARLRVEQPECGISWTTLVGIGRVESDHGRFGGSQLGEDGRPTIPIYGVPLDGSPGVMAIPDTDGGAMDGDDVWDRAMGPMQFLPTTWELVGRDADGDGVADPQNIDDAALSAATYLCSAQRDLTTGTGWWAAVLTYNNSVDYGRRVFGLAETYAGYRPEEQAES
ncbi:MULTISPECIES: lytic transglycosylase domain-containing protein [Actinoalloteichus]|uniref:Transglycosylase SLT domain n=1 Tax=Actinoalloteichus fjordicus TaxID=1612552 RepID=A0AAC9L7Z7_9PSEU|nr:MULTISPECIES: lytic murein transglycosylase [Actinoalloteichus]APU12823.1 Transglycosylase SLT domain [Actinoalloteichus fjordicus]APU18795.1 Transglycosylase SLT domain [Actinoalloteichus sp. GBA129-24]